MTFAQKLGASYTQAQEQAKIKAIKLSVGEAEFTLRVRIPIKKEMEEITLHISNPAKDLIQSIYETLANPIKASALEGGEDFIKSFNAESERLIIKENDVILDGTSLQNAAMLMAMWQTKVESMFHLLQSETGEPINESYDQITEEFPESVIRLIVDEIEQAIKPDYKSAKKN